MSDERFYDEVARELQERTLLPGLWTKAFAETDGDKDKARALYIRYRVEQLAQRERDELHRAEVQRQEQSKREQRERKEQEQRERERASEQLWQQQQRASEPVLEDGEALRGLAKFSFYIVIGVFVLVILIVGLSK